MINLRKSLRTFLVIPVALIGVLFSTAPAASAATTGPYVLNQDAYVTSHDVLCKTDGGASYRQTILKNQYSDRGCTYIEVNDTKRIRYHSVSTGGVYWTPCGYTIYPSASGYSGWWNLGGTSSVVIEKTVNYPTPPAESCNGHRA